MPALSYHRQSVIPKNEIAQVRCNGKETVKWWKVALL
jgi:hypothetical protein